MATSVPGSSSNDDATDASVSAGDSPSQERSAVYSSPSEESSSDEQDDNTSGGYSFPLYLPTPEPSSPPAFHYRKCGLRLGGYLKFRSAPSADSNGSWLHSLGDDDDDDHKYTYQCMLNGKLFWTPTEEESRTTRVAQELYDFTLSCRGVIPQYLKSSEGYVETSWCTILGKLQRLRNRLPNLKTAAAKRSQLAEFREDIQIQLKRYISGLQYDFEQVKEIVADRHNLHTLFDFKPGATRYILNDGETLMKSLVTTITYADGQNFSYLDEANLMRMCLAMVCILKSAFYKDISDYDQIKHHREVEGRLLDLYAALDANVEGDAALENFLAVFRATIIGQHLEERKYYYRGVALIQSSGVGKSRLLRNIGRSISSFTIVLDKDLKYGTSVPTCDYYIREYFQGESKRYRGHHLFAAFLAAFFHQLMVHLASPLRSWEGNFPNAMRKFLPTGFNIEDVTLTDAQAETVFARARVERDIWKRQEATLVTEIGSMSFIVKRIRLLQPFSSEATTDRYKTIYIGNEERGKFLRSVVGLAIAILKKSGLPTYEQSQTAEDIEAKDVSYIDKSGLSDYLRDFFGVLDAVEGVLDHPPEQLAQQFCFSIDGCSYLDDLIEQRSNDQCQSQGLECFARVVHDLDVHAGKRDKWDHRCRLWLFSADTNIKGRLLVPQMASDVTQLVTDQAHGIDYEDKHTIWNRFEMHHQFYRERAKDDKYLVNMMINHAFSFKQLMKMGRGLWNAHHPNELMTVAARSIMTTFAKWHERPIFKSPYSRADDEKLCQVSFAIASIRFNFDDGVQMSRVNPAYHYITEAVAKHMRVFVGVSDEGILETATPSDPMLAIGAMFLLNYARNFLPPEDRPGLPVNLVPQCNDGPWSNLLREIQFGFEASHGLVNAGENGETIARVVLSRARDICLPQLWGEEINREKVAITSLPLTTVEDFLGALLGEEIADKALSGTTINTTDDGGAGTERGWTESASASTNSNKRVKLTCIVGAETAGTCIVPEANHALEADDASHIAKCHTRRSTRTKRERKACEKMAACCLDPRIRKALVSFTHFAYEDAPGDCEETRGAILDWQLLKGFLTGAAYICRNDANITDIKIPIMIPKDARKKREDCIVADYMLAYIGISMRWQEDGLCSDVKLHSDPIVKPKEDATEGREGAVTLAETAAIVLLMDMGVRGSKGCFSKGELGYISPHVVATLATEGMQGGAHTKPFLAIRARGLNDVYPCMKQIDSHNTFQKTADYTMRTSRRNVLVKHTQATMKVPIEHRVNQYEEMKQCFEGVTTASNFVLEA